MALLSTILIGFVIGLVARFLKPGDDRMGIVWTTLVGIGGAFVGSYLGQWAGIYKPGQPAGFVGAVIGAVFLLIALKILFGRK